MDEAAKAWCDEARVLLRLPSQRRKAASDGADGFAPRWEQARAAWNEASDIVDAQIAALQAALVKSPDPELQLIGELGLNGVTGNFRVPLLAAVQSLSRVPADQRAPAVAAARKAIAAFRGHLQTSPEVEVVDDNPMEVPVRIAATLLPALDALEQSLLTAG